MARSQPKANGSVDQLPAVRFNRMAIFALVLSILSIGGIGSIAGVVLAVRANRRITETGERGLRLTVAAIAVGVITLLLSIAFWVNLGTNFVVTPGHGGG